MGEFELADRTTVVAVLNQHNKSTRSKETLCDCGYAAPGAWLGPGVVAQAFDNHRAEQVLLALVTTGWRHP